MRQLELHRLELHSVYWHQMLVYTGLRHGADALNVGPRLGLALLHGRGCE